MPKRDRAAYMRAYRAQKRAARKRAAVPAPKAARNPAAAVARWTAKTLQVPAGLLRGQPFTLADWQVAWLRGALAPGIREAGLSVARKNGKSGLVAALLLAHLVGPLRRPAWRAVVCSLTGNLAKELRRQVEEIARASGLYDAEAAAASRLPTGDRIAAYQTPQPGRIVGPDGDVTCLAADRATGHAVGADLAIVDEAGLLQEKHRDLWNAMQSCMSGRAGRLLAISIRGDGPMFAELAARQADPAVHWVEYAAPAGGALDDPAHWTAANPGLANGIKSIEHMQDRARAVASSPLDQASFRAHDLNLPQSPSRELLCAPEDWHRCEVASAADLPPRDGSCVVGFDLGYDLSMSAVVAYWPNTWRMEVWAAFPDLPDLSTRGRADGIGDRYVEMAARKELLVYPGRVVPVGTFLGDVARALAGETVMTAVADSCRRAEAEQALSDAGAPWPVTWRANAAGGKGGHDGSHDVRAFQRAVLQGEMRCVESLVMRQAITETDVKRAGMGHPSLGRHRTRGRIDAVAAAVLALGAATRPESDPLVRYYASGGKVEIVGV